VIEVELTLLVVVMGVVNDDPLFPNKLILDAVLSPEYVSSALLDILYMCENILAYISMYKHHVHRDTAMGRPKRSGLAYIQSAPQHQFNFQSSAGFRKPSIGKQIVLGRIASPWATVQDYSHYQSLASLAGHNY